MCVHSLSIPLLIYLTSEKQWLQFFLFITNIAYFILRNENSEISTTFSNRSLYVFSFDKNKISFKEKFVSIGKTYKS